MDSHPNRTVTKQTAQLALNRPIEVYLLTKNLLESLAKVIHAEFKCI